MNQTIASLYKQYLRSSGNRPATIESKERTLKYFLDCAGVIDLESVRYYHAEDYRNYLLDRSICAKSINLYCKHFKHFLSWCCKRQYLSLNPWIELTNLPTEDELTQPFEDEEVSRLIQVAFPLWQIIIALGYTSGLRQAEVLNLVKEDFLFEKQLLQVRPKKKTSDTWDWSIKNRKSSFAPLPEYCVINTIKIPLHQMIKGRMDEIKHPYLFVDEQNYLEALKLKRVQSRHLIDNFDRKFKHICKLACVRRGSYQCLRVTFIKKFREAGYDPKKIQVLARHRNISTTMRYYCFEDDKELALKASEVFKRL